MEIFVFIIIAGIIASIVRIVSINNLNDLFEKIAASLGLEFKKGDFWEAPKISGKIEECQVKIQKISRDKKDFIEIEAKKGLDVPANIRITKETVFTRMQRVLGIKDIETGHEYFDDEILLESSYPQTLVGLLNEKIRELILDLVVHSSFFEVKDSIVIAQVQKRMGLETAAIVKPVQLVVAVARDLAEKIPMEKRFARNIQSDPVTQVRINNIRAMTAHLYNKPEIHSILKSALSNSAVEVQFEAAKHLEEDGMEHMLKIFESAGESLNRPLLMEMVEIFKQNNFSKSIPALKKIYHTGWSFELKTSILKAFTSFADTGLNSFLLAELEEESPELQLYIIEALGTCGQVDAVEKLYRIAKAKFAPITRLRVKEAIARIQSRLGNVEKGWLSVTQLQDVDGALSIAPQAAGEGALSTTGEKQEDEKKGAE